MPTLEEVQAELAKRDEQIRGLSTKLQANERIVKELGEAVERDAYGNPVRLVVSEEPTRPLEPAYAGSHPLSELGMSNPKMVDDYYLQLVSQKGYLTKQEAEALAEAKARQYASMVMGNLMVMRNHDKLTAQPGYADLLKADSGLSKRTARILQERGYGTPVSDAAKGFDQWNYRELGDLQFAADLAQIEMAKEAAASQASSATAAATQSAAELATTSSGGVGVASSVEKPDFAALSTPAEIVDALDKSLAAAGQ